MKVLITGASGMVGQALSSLLKSHGHAVESLSRPNDWNPETGHIVLERLEGFDAVIHLAGESIASGRWTDERKKRIRQSRIQGTRLLSDALNALSRPPKVLISASAIGYYGERGSQKLTEEAPAGSGFLADVCRGWEEAARLAERAGIRVVCMRLGIVLSRKGGALEKMMPPFKLGVGGVLGDGCQYMSWITLHDLCRAIEFFILNETLTGAVNAVAPDPVTNQVFTRALATALHRPALLPVPSFALRLAAGELADALLLASTRVIPQKLLTAGFEFEDADLTLALADIAGTLFTLRTSQWIPHPPDEVFPFFANASNLEQLTPPWLKFEILSPEVQVKQGALIDYRLHLHGIPLRWQSEIVEWQPPYRFVDAQRRGPYSIWVHEHRFKEKDGGTLIEDCVRYSAPGGCLVRKLLIARDLDRIFNYRKARLEERFA